MHIYVRLNVRERLIKAVKAGNFLGEGAGRRHKGYIGKAQPI